MIKQEFVDGGIVTVIVQGDVGAVQAAVDAGREAAKRVGELLGAHVIPRPDESVYKMVEPLDYNNYEEQKNRRNQPAPTSKAQVTKKTEVNGYGRMSAYLAFRRNKIAVIGAGYTGATVALMLAQK